MKRSLVARRRFAPDEAGVLRDREGHALRLSPRVLGALVGLTIDDANLAPDDLSIVGDYRGDVFSEPSRTDEGPAEHQDEEPPAPLKIVWERYVELGASVEGIDTGRMTLNATRRRLIEMALKTRPVDVVLLAVAGLFVSPWHTGENEQRKLYLDIRYALKGNSQRGESNEERIDKMAALGHEVSGIAVPSVLPDKVRRLLDSVQYAVETGGEVNRGREAKEALEEMGYRVLRVESAPWARLERAP